MPPVPSLPVLPDARRAGAKLGWPNRPVRFIVPLAPGGAIDFIARALGERMSATIGQNVLVENRTGAGGTIGMDAAMKSPPDGYTVLITNDNAASAPHIMKLGHDYTKELVPVCFLGRHGQILAAHSSIGVKPVPGAGRLRQSQSGRRHRDLGRRLQPARAVRMAEEGNRREVRSRALSRRGPGDQ